jgi:DNA-binding XRE family transcriptional regulator
MSTPGYLATHPKPGSPRAAGRPPRLGAQALFMIALTFCCLYYTVCRMIALNEGNLAQNVRRLAGMHLVSMDKLSQFVGVNRQTMQAIVSHDFDHRSLPKTTTAIKIAEAFAIPLNVLYQEPVQCLRVAVEHFEEAPIRKAVQPPASVRRRATSGRVADKGPSAGPTRRVHQKPPRWPKSDQQEGR